MCLILEFEVHEASGQDEKMKVKWRRLRVSWSPWQVHLVASDLVGVSVLQNLGSFAMKPDTYIWSRSVGRGRWDSGRPSHCIHPAEELSDK